MKFGSLFSGIGGFDLGFERAGMSCAWQCEIDTACQKLLSQKFGVRLYDDVRSITAGNTEPVDLICGGFPCQDVSIAGKREGLAGERSGLWGEFARIIDEFKPRWVVVENVPGLLSSNQGRDFETVISQMVESGYGVCWRILDAQYFGVAQRRRRVFIVGSLGDGRSAEVLFEREGVRWNHPPRGKTGKGIAYATLDNTTAPGARHGYTELANTLENQSTSNIVFSSGVANTLAGGSSKAHSDMTSGQQDGNVIAATSRTLRQGKEGGGKGYLGSEELGMTLGGQQQFVGVRRLTPTECERLQGFPDGWTAGQADSTRYKQLGNAVAVPVAEWIGRRIMQL